MASQEMLKKLLEEFDDKEAQAREEINIVNLRVEELEKRIGSSRQRLEKISVDRGKIGEMMERYMSGAFFKKGAVTYSSAVSAASPAASTPPSAKAQKSDPAPAAAPAPAPTSPPPSISSPMHSQTISPGSGPAQAAPATPPALSVVNAAPPPPPLNTNFAALEPEAPPPVEVPPPMTAPTPAPTPVLSPLASLGAASLFTSPPSTFGSSTDTGDNPALAGEAAAAAAASPFASSVPSAPSVSSLGGLSAALMQSMPVGGTGATPQENRGPGNFDMMDLFAPLANEEEAAPTAPVASPAPNVAEEALAQNQFYPTTAALPTTPAPVATAGTGTMPPRAPADDAPFNAMPTQDHPSLDLDEEGEEPEEEEGDDSNVKSINDALRGLFR